MARAPRPTKDNLAKAREASFANAMARIAKIIAPGVVGFHTHFEIIEIIEFSNVARKATNVFTILVAEEHNEGVSETPGWLGDRIRLPQFKDSFFGVRRTVQPIAAILPRLNEIINGTWRFSSDTIELGEMACGRKATLHIDDALLRGVIEESGLKHGTQNTVRVIVHLRHRDLARFDSLF